MDRRMFYGAKPEIFANAKWLRANMTQSEKLLWSHLKENKLGVRFKPQHPIDIFIADFYCHELKLVIEIDGEIHEKQKEYDAGRTSELQHYDIEVMRFTNAEVMQSIDKVLEQIKIRIDKRRLMDSAL
ncbi:MAG TPA: DUF559 domain-containing protein [Bacteroidia bacterium]|nr:endonuclease domain-containing protein [Bacteroidia bacterium]QQR95389.1 MAG: endonuclease domain-containing protein [Bacteroidota bacterium]MBP7715125.1 endonuclease domain-containing protein [Bacteroidia bacterium]MBP8669108.1 endonuclease domain-containing protein [Bacteroidia bacterium]HOZ89671.1 DUF559 domain-containing protein [Bacteroidia bacterium]